MSYALNDLVTKIDLMSGETLPPQLILDINDPSSQTVAWNAAFEIQANPNRLNKLMAWFRVQGFPMKPMDEEQISDALAMDENEILLMRASFTDRKDDREVVMLSDIRYLGVAKRMQLSERAKVVINSFEIPVLRGGSEVAEAT